MPSRFVMIEGIDGSGKSTVTRAIREWAVSCNHRVFDLSAWCAEKGTLPRYEDIADFDVYFTFEPTKAWAGSAIRAMIAAGSDRYSGVEQAHAFSVDRLVLYRRLIIPALLAGKTVIQDRGVTTSIVYQPMMPGGPTLDQVLELPGNVLALSHRPDHLIVTDLPPEMALKRLAVRNGEAEQVFERLELLKTFTERYQSAWFAKIFTDRGTQMHRLDTSGTIEEVNAAATKLVSSILPTC